MDFEPWVIQTLRSSITYLRLTTSFPRNMANVSLDRAFGGTKIPLEYPYFQMSMNPVRLTDLSISRYEASRDALATYRSGALGGHVSPYYDAINGLEETVVAAYRACLNSQRLVLVAPEKLNAPTVRQAQLLKQVRHRIQHMDEKLERGTCRSATRSTG